MGKSVKDRTVTVEHEPEAQWMRDRVAAARTTPRKAKAKAIPPTTADPPPPPEEDHAPRAAFGTVPELPAPPAAVTLKDVCARWLDHMRGLGKSQATVASYAGDLEIATKHFGDGAVIPTADEVRAYEESEAVTRTRTGKPKAKPTILKTRRALRLAVTWAKGAGIIDASPYAAGGRDHG